MGFDVYTYTNKGGRGYNEDSVDYEVQESSGVFVVADGLGGHSFGELASACVCETLVGGWNGAFGEQLPGWLANRIVESNSRILQLQQEKGTVLKSTAAILAVDNMRASWANVGDSRLYYIHRDVLANVTNDHSVAFKKYKGGEITRNDIRTDPDQSSLLRSLGGTSRFEPELYGNGTPLEPGDAFFLCTDGVWEFLQDEEIVIDYLKAANAEEWGRLLLLRVMDRVSGEHDNLSFITMIVDGPRPAEADFRNMNYPAPVVKMPSPASVDVPPTTPAAVQEQAVSGVGAAGTGPQAVNAFAGPSGTSTSVSGASAVGSSIQPGLTNTDAGNSTQPGGDSGGSGRPGWVKWFVTAMVAILVVLIAIIVVKSKSNKKDQDQKDSSTRIIWDTEQTEEPLIILPEKPSSGGATPTDPEPETAEKPKDDPTEEPTIHGLPIIPVEDPTTEEETTEGSIFDH